MIDPDAPAVTSSAALDSAVLEKAAYGALACCALLARLAMLGHWPLLEEEIPSALAAVQVLSGRALTVHGYLPLLFDAQLLALTGHSTPFAARLLTASAGSLLVLVPWAARRWLGRPAALAVAVVLAVSPLWVYAGRTADGGVVSVGLAMLSLVLLANARNGHGVRYARAGWACLGLALCAGPQALGVLVGLAAAAAVSWRRADATDREDWATHCRSLISLRAVWPGLAAWFLAATACLFHPAGLGAAADLLGSWFGALLPAGNLPVYHTLVVLGVYEPALLVLSGYALWRGWRARARLDLALGAWLITALVLGTCCGQREARWVITLAVPLALLGGRGVGYLIGSGFMRLTSRGWWAIGASICLLGFSYVELGAYLRQSGAQQLVLALVGGGVLAASLVGYRIWLGPDESWSVALALVLFVASIFTVRGTAALAFERTRDSWEPLLTETTAGTLRDLEPFLEHISLSNVGDAHTADIIYEESLAPDIEWLLRDYPQARSAVRVGQVSGATILISGEREAGDEPAGYVGQPWALRERSVPGLRTVQQTLQWLLFRLPGPAVEQDRFWVWVKMPPGEQDGD